VKGKAKRGPAGTFKPAETEGRVDLGRVVKTSWVNRVHPDELELEGRIDTSGRSGEPTARRLRTAPIRRAKESEGRTNAFKPETHRVLNDEGKRNRSRPEPYYREARCLENDPLKVKFIQEIGSLWMADQDVVLSYSDDKVTPTLSSWGPTDTSIPVPKGTFITYAGTRRIDARMEPKGSDKEIHVRCTQYMFVVASKRCTVWDFSMITPVVDDDEGSDDEDESDE
jgi:hypothetical protein